MNNHEWLNGHDPLKLLNYLLACRSAVGVGDTPYPVPNVSDRKLRLIAVACCRCEWSLMPGVCRNAIATAEMMADEQVTQGMMYDAIEPVGWLLSNDFGQPTANQVRDRRLALAAFWVAPQTNRADVANCVIASVGHMRDAFPSAMPRLADIVRDIVGNPFRPACSPRHNRLSHMLAAAAYNDRPRRHCDACRGRGIVLTMKMLESRYAAPDDLVKPLPPPVQMPCDRCNGTGIAESHHLDSLTLNAVADSLEESGCDNANIISHLRSPGPHVRGCWAVDLIMGRR